MRLKPLTPVLFALLLQAGNLFSKEAEFIIVPPSSQLQIETVKGLIERRLPKVAQLFELELLEKTNGHDVFEVASANGKIIVRGSSGVAMATGWNWYLKNICNQHMSWCGSRMDLTPAGVKPVPGGIHRSILPNKKVVYMNYCTLSYSMAWWDWERWEWETDLMAMNGINMPLGVVGVEAVWYNALTRVGFSDEEARAFLSGPSYHAWQWMQNIEGAAGPLPKSWIDSHIALGKKLLDRQRAFGMTPVQQGFSGHVPIKFIEKFPEAKIRRQGNWCDFPGVAQLDPMDPLFFKFGKIFMEEEGKLFGLGGYYAADPFHESAPPKDIKKEDLPVYLDNVGKSIHQIFDAVDPKSMWVMQSWSILKDIACAPPAGRLMVVDLAGDKWERTDGFWGRDFVVGQLHNFGGRTELHGDLKHIASNRFLTAKAKYPNTAVGAGLFMEGIIQNPVFYDLVFDLFTLDHPVNIHEWISAYVTRRYGVSDGPVHEAWEKIIMVGPYKPGSAGMEMGSVVCARPALNVHKSGPNAEFNVFYKPTDLLDIWNLMLSDEARCAASEGYRYDVVDFGRQLMSYYGQELIQDVRTAYQRKNSAEFQRTTHEFLALLGDIDRLCETRKEMRFGEWLSDARRWGTTSAEADLFDKNASMLVTIWGPERNPEVNCDYSWREWSGLIREFYVQRWTKFFNHLSDHLTAGTSYVETGRGREPWKKAPFFADLAKWEIQWINAPKSNWQKLDVGDGDELKVSRAMADAWSPVVRKAYQNSDLKARERREAAGEMVVLDWAPQSLGSDVSEILVDVTKGFDLEGKYEVEFRYLKGGCGLDIESVTLMQGEVELSQDKHPGFSGNSNENNIYKVKLDMIANNAKYLLKLRIKGRGGNSTYGTVSVRKLGMK